MSTDSHSSSKISLLAASIVGINAMVGVGIVTLPCMLSQSAGPASILSYALSICVVLALGVALGRVAFRYPGSGWTYLYPSQWAGHKVGLVSAFSYVLGVLIAMGFLIQQAGIWSHKIIPLVPETALGVGITLVLMLLVLGGANASSIGQYIIGACVIIPLLLTAITCWFNFDINVITPFMPKGILSVFLAAPEALFAFLGFECIVSLYPVVRDPHKNVPKAFLIAILTVGLLYLFFAGGLLSAIPAYYFAQGAQVTLSHVLEQALPSVTLLSTVLLIGAMFGIIGTIHSMLWATSTLLTDILKKVKLDSVQKLFDKNLWNDFTSTIISTGIMLLSAFLFHAKALVRLTDVLLLIPSILSIISLFFIKEEWEGGRNIITIIALIGGVIMFCFASWGFIESII